MVRRSLTYANFKLMRKAFAEAEEFVRDLLGTDNTVILNRDNFLVTYFSPANKLTFLNNVRAFIVLMLKDVSDKYPEGPIKVNDKMEIYTDKKMPTYLIELLTGKVQ